MTIFSGSPLTEAPERGIEELPLSTGRYVGESFKQGFLESPGAQMWRATEVMATDPQWQTYAPDMMGPLPDFALVPKIPMEEAKKRVKDAGLEHQLDNLGSAPEMNERALDVMMRHARERQHREANLARGPSGILPGVAATGAGFLGGAIDPLSMAAFAMPVVGEARVAQLMASAGTGVLGRAAVRAGVGAASGAVGMTALQPAEWFFHTEDGRDFGFADALKNIAMGAGLGGVFHAGFGAGADVWRSRVSGKPLYPFAPGEPYERPPAGTGTPPPPPPPHLPGRIAPGAFPGVDDLMAHPEVADRKAHPTYGFNVSDVLATPRVAEEVERPQVNREHDVPYGALASETRGTFVDRNIPQEATIDGVTFDPAVPLSIASHVQKEALERRIAQIREEKGREPTNGEMERIVGYINDHYTTPAEKAWVLSQGVDWEKYQEAKRSWIEGIDHENPVHPPEGAYLKSLPPRVRERLRGGARPPEPPQSTTGLTEMGGNMAAGMAESLHQHLWNRIQAGEVTEQRGMGPSALLQAAKVIRARGGLKTFEEYKAFADDYGRNIHEGTPTFQQDMRKLVERHVPKAPPAPPAPPPGSIDAFKAERDQIALAQGERLAVMLNAEALEARAKETGETSEALKARLQSEYDAADARRTEINKEIRRAAPPPGDAQEQARRQLLRGGVVPDADLLARLTDEQRQELARFSADTDAEVKAGKILPMVGDLRKRQKLEALAAPPVTEADATISPENRAQPVPGPLPNRVGTFAPDELLVDAKRFQFKSGGDENGVTERLKGIRTWDELKSGILIVWEDNDGKFWVVDGHQRHALATRIAAEDSTQNPRLVANIVREKDGVTDVLARVYAASVNIAEGTGTAIDAAKILRDNPAMAAMLPPRSELVRQARGLANLSADAFLKVVDEIVPANYAAIVGRLIPRDADLQRALLDLLEKTGPANIVQAEAIVRRGIENAKADEGRTDGLSADSEIAKSLYAERATILDRALKELKLDKKVFEILSREGERIREVEGNALAADLNERRLAADATALQVLQILAGRAGPVANALDAAARRIRDGDKPADAVRDFVAALRRLAESGDLARDATRLPVSPTHVGDEDAASVVEPAAEEPAAGVEHEAAAQVRDVIDQEEQQRASEPTAVSAADFDAALDAALDAEFGPEEPAPARSRPAEPRPLAKPSAAPAAPERPLPEVAKSAVTNLAEAADNAMAGLVELFGGGKTQGAGLAFDEATYARAKPLFIQAAVKFRAFTADVNELVRRMVAEMAKRHGLDREAFERMRPYMRRFVSDVQSGAIDLKKSLADEQRSAITQRLAPMIRAAQPHLPEELAQADAAVVADRYVTRAAALGEDPMQAFERANVEVRAATFPGIHIGEEGREYFQRKRRPSLPAGQIRKFRELLNAGKSPEEIAKEMGITPFAATALAKMPRETNGIPFEEGNVRAVEAGRKGAFATAARSRWALDDKLTERLLLLRSQGKTSKEIAKALGPDMTANMVLGRVNRLGIERHERFWTEEQTDALRDGAEKRLSAAQIAKQLGRSEKAVLHRAAALDLEIAGGRAEPGLPQIEGLRKPEEEFTPAEMAELERIFSYHEEDGKKEFFQRPTAPPFYSAVERAVNASKQAKASPDQWLATIKNTAGVRPEEMEWLGLDDWLKEQKGSVSKQEVADYVRANRIEVKEVTKGGQNASATRIGEIDHRINELSLERHRIINDPTAQQRRSEIAMEERNLLDERRDLFLNMNHGNETKYSTYQLPGGENYRELLLTLPTTDTAQAEAAIRGQINTIESRIYERTGMGEAFDRETNADPELRRLYQELSDIKSRDRGYRSSHWDEPNIVAHVRFNERVMPLSDSEKARLADLSARHMKNMFSLSDAEHNELNRLMGGKRTLFVEEVQSDWHQRGREKGYNEPESVARIDASRREWEAMRPEVAEMVKRNDRLGFDTTEEALSAIRAESPDRWEFEKPEDQALAQKYHDVFQLLRKAEEHVQHGVPDAPFKTTWPELAMKRMLRYAAEEGYDQVAWTTGETQAERYDLSKQVDRVTYAPESKHLRAYKNGEVVIRKEVEPNDLPDVIGKEAAEKLLKTEVGPDSAFKGARVEDVHALEGLDLKVGGEGMKGFYDEILPKTVNKLGKKYGAKVGKGEIETSERIPGDQLGWYVDEGVDHRGRPEFNVRDNNTGEIQDRFTTRAEAEQMIAEAGRGTGERVEAKTEPVHVLPITDKLREAATEQGFPLFQPGREGEPQGRVTFLNNRRIIELFQKANASTAPHEFAHVWLEELHEDAAHPNAPDWLKADLKIVRDWLGAKGNDPLSDEQHEQFARGFEQYLREGRAPSRRLAAIFAKFAEWLRAIYRSALELGVPINDEVRGVLDRILATHEDIAEYANDRPPRAPEPMEHPPARGEEGPTVNPATGTNEVLPPVQSQDVLKGAIGSLIEGRPVRAREQIEATKPPPEPPAPPPQRPAAASGPRAKDPANRTLFEHLAASPAEGGVGGIQPTPDLQAILGRVGPFVSGWGPLLRPKGRPIDLIVHDGDVEAYLGKDATVRDLMAAISDEARGRKRYVMGNEPVSAVDEDASRAAHEREIIGMLEDAGIAREDLGSDRIDRVIEIMQRERVDDPEVAFEQAVMEEARRAEDAGEVPPVPPELHVPGWDDDGTAAPEAGGVLRPFGPAEGAGSRTVAPSRGEGAQPPPSEPITPTVSLANHFRDYFLALPEFLEAHGAHLEEGNRFATIVQARRFAKEMGFGDDAKAIDEAIEQGAVQAARAIALGEGSEADKYAALVQVYDRQPRLSVRTSTSMRDQAYSTPVPLAYLASRLARVEPMRSVYEPSAGNGALLMEVEPPEYASANEINPDRARALEAQGFTVTRSDASDPERARILRDHGGVHIVLANPPFGAVKEGTASKVFDLSDIQRGYKTHEIDHAIVLRSLEAMKDDGRAVLLIGGVNKLARTEEARSDAYNAKAKREFFLTLFKNYKVTDMFTVAGELYERQGAGWPIDVIVINGRGKSERKLPAVELPKVYKSWDDLAEVLTNAQRRGDEGVSGGQPGATPVEVPAAGAGGADAGGGAAAGGGEPAGGIAPEGEPGNVRVGSVPGEPGNGVPGGAGVETPSGEMEPGGGLRGAGGPGGEPFTEQRPPGVAETVLEPGKPENVKPRIVRTETETGAQVAYTPQSNHGNLGVLVPVNMRKSISDALAAVAERRGDVDKFVADELGYSPNVFGASFAAEQIDALALALDNIKDNKGFVIGDQTGLGKGRVNAGIIRWAIRNSRIPIFVTEKPNLYGDMYRDLTDIDLAGMLGREPRLLMTNAGEDVPLDEDGKVRLKTASAKAHNEMLASLPGSAKEFLKQYDAVFTNYSQMQTVAGGDTPRRAFLDRIAPQSVVIFDESHNAGGQKKEWASGPPDRAAFARMLVAKAQGVFYSSATYAKRPDVMDLYAKTDMAMAVANPKDLGEAIAKGGVPMQQAVAAMLSRAGQYIRRERSFAGISYDTPSVPVDRATYDGISRALNAVNEFSKKVAKAAEEIDQSIKAEAGSLGHDTSVGDVGAKSTNFTSIMHNIVGQILLAMKAKPAAKMAIEALEKGEKPVLTVSSTMESFLTDYAEQVGIKHGEPIPADFSHVLKKYLDRTRTLIIKKPFAKKGESERKYLSDAELGPEGVRAYKDALSLIQKLDLKDLPISPIDVIKNELTQAGYRVGEITGRGTIVDYSGTQPVLKPRPGGEVTIKGRRETISRFNGGAKDRPLPKEQVYDAMVINQAGSTGLSLHASERVAEQQPRVMFIVQPEANIDTHMQLLGRIHRTGQVVLPRYAQLIADIPAEKRPAAVLAKKMASLNANTTAARGSAMTAKDVPDFMNLYGDMVAAALVSENPELNGRLGNPVKFNENGKIEAEDAMRKLTGRIPLLPLGEQERLYAYLESEYNSLLDQMKAAGENALEAQTLDLRAQTVERREVVARKAAADSPFAAPVQVEKVMARRLGKPFRSDEVVNKILENIGQTVPEGVTAQNAARVLSDLADRNKPLGRLAAATHEKQAADAVAKFEDYKRGVVDDIENPDRAEAQRAKMDADKDRFETLHEQLVPGSRLNLKTANGNLVGIVLKVEQKGKPKNPLALSTWKADIAIADATKRIELPFSRLFAEGTADPENMLAIEMGHMSDWIESRKQTLERFDRLQSDVREERYIATGNLLAAYDWLNRKGRIVNYTDSEGHTRQGILTPRDFNFDEHAQSKATPIGDEKAVMQWLRDNPRTELKTDDGAVKVILSPGRGAQISVAGARRVGGGYYLDKELTDAIGRDFKKLGGSMVAGVEEQRLEAGIRRIQELGGKFVAVKDLPPAEQVAAPPPRSPTMTPHEAWDQLAKEPLPHEERESVEASREAERMKEPESVSTDPSVRAKAAAKAAEESVEQFESSKGYMSDEDRKAYEEAMQEHDREQQRRAEVIKQGIACLSAGGFGKEKP